MIRVENSAADVTIQGCVLDGAQQAEDMIFYDNQTSGTITNNTLVALASTNVAGAIHLAGSGTASSASGVTIADNYIGQLPSGVSVPGDVNVYGFGIYGNPGPLNTTVTGNRIEVFPSSECIASLNDPTNSSYYCNAAIALHGALPGYTVSGTNIHDNPSLASGGGWCVEVGAFGGDVPSYNVVVSDNKCISFANNIPGAPNAVVGGYSIWDTSGVHVSGNNYDSSNTIWTQIAGYEIGDTQGGAVSANHAVIRNTDATDRQAAFNCNTCNNTYFGPSNIADGFGLASSSAAFYISPDPAHGVHSDGNVFDGNTANPSPNAVGLGFWMQCWAASGTTCDNNTFENNTAYALDNSTVGLQIEIDAGQGNGNSVTGNTFDTSSPSQTCVALLGTARMNPIPYPSPWPNCAVVTYN